MFLGSVPIFRGPVLWPVSPERLVAFADGVVGPDSPEPRPASAGDPPPVDGLILPAFADWHFHWVQAGIAGVARDGRPPLLDWLRDVAWPEEERFAGDEAASRAAAAAVVRRLAAVGTAAGAAYANSHGAAAAAFLDAAGPGFVCGPAVMTADGPPRLVRSLGETRTELEALHARFGSRLVVAPRFALSCDDATLAALGAFAARHGLLVQTHLAENSEEVAEVAARFPAARDYLDVYERAGLLGPRTLLAHVIHVSDDALRRIAAAGAVVVHCPTSNRALGSGRMPLERLREAGVRWVLGSDVGAGPSFCMLDVISEALAQHAECAPLTAAECLHRATLGRAAVTAGRTENNVPCGARPGALVVALPAGLDLHRPDGDAWLEALLDVWRRERTLAVRRIDAAV